MSVWCYAKSGTEIPYGATYQRVRHVRAATASLLPYCTRLPPSHSISLLLDPTPYTLHPRLQTLDPRPWSWTLDPRP
eukprot:1000509-Rhodomonas_salina.2